MRAALTSANECSAVHARGHPCVRSSAFLEASLHGDGVQEGPGLIYGLLRQCAYRPAGHRPDQAGRRDGDE